MRAGSPGRRGATLGGEVDARDLGGDVHDLAHRDPVAAAEVVDGLERAARLEGLRRHHVGVREVGDVDVVADAGAVGGGVVVAVDPRGAAALQHLQHQREQVVRAGVVEVRGRRADHVEVAQRRVREAVPPGTRPAPGRRSATPRSACSPRTATPGASASASVTRSTSGVPYVAAELEKTIRPTPSASICSSSVAVPVTFCW